MAYKHSTEQETSGICGSQHHTTSSVMLAAIIAIAVVVATCGIAVSYPVWASAHTNDAPPVVVDKTVEAVPQPTIIIRQNVPAPNQAIIAKREADARAAAEAKAAKEAEEAAAQAAAEEAARQQQQAQAAAQAQAQQEAAAQAAQQQSQTQNASWMNPTGAQPNLADYTNLSIRVSLAEQQVHIMSNGQDIYVMRASTGIGDATPHGHYVINGLRGDSFYNPNEGMGARYWVGFIGGVYLFHSVPTDVNGNWIASEGDKLGQPASHGCVRLSVADAAWFYQQIPNGTPIDIG